MISLASLLAAACECSSTETAETRALDDAGRDSHVESGAASGTGGRGTGGGSDSGAAGSRDAGGSGGREHDAAADGTDSALDAAADQADALPPVSVRCGDGIRGADEECDDGNSDEADFCTFDCRVRDRIAVGPTEPPSFIGKLRTIPRGRHVVAVGRDSSALLFVDESVNPKTLGLVTYDAGGKRLSGDAGVTVSDADGLYVPADAHVTALPDGKHAVVWTASGGSVLHTALRIVDGATGSMSATQTLSSSAHDAQDSDAVWTGSELVVAWTANDGAQATTKVHARRYDAMGTAVAAEAVEGSDDKDNGTPTLAPFAGGFALAWSESTAGANVTYLVKGAGQEWQVGPFTGSSGGSAALAALDDTHLFVVVPPREYETDAGQYRARLYGAVLDTTTPGSVTPFLLVPLDSDRAADRTREAQYPALTVTRGKAYLAWHLGQGDSVFDTELLLKEMTWSSGGLDRTHAEIPLARDRERQGNFQNYPALAASRWTTGGALFAAWEDGNRTYGQVERYPDVLAALIPLPILRLAGGPDGDI